jgi:XTP/dITP diphosphohydrolase
LPDLILATRNPGKIEEIRAFLSPAHPRLRLIPMADVKGLPQIAEDGSSFLENAKKKAMLVSTFAGKPALADDSGLEVEALGGRPGVLSARFAGPNATDAENTRKLLDKLTGVPEGERTAAFRCAMVLCAPNGHTMVAVGELSGRILDSPRGTGGFGYDPVFLLPESGRTLAELSMTEKNRISHRARALEKIAARLEGFLAKA